MRLVWPHEWPAVTCLLSDVTEALQSKTLFSRCGSIWGTACLISQEKWGDQNTQKKEEGKSHYIQRKETNEKERNQSDRQTFGTLIRRLGFSLTFSRGLWWGGGHGVCAAGLRFLLLRLLKAPLTRLERTANKEKSSLTRSTSLSKQWYAELEPNPNPFPEPGKCADLCTGATSVLTSILTSILTPTCVLTPTSVLTPITTS